MTLIAVPFAGEGAGEDELSWGQQDIWGSMRRDRSWLPIGFARPVPPGTTIDDIVDELRFCLSRYQSMRTKLRFTADGRPRQVVHACGEVTLEVVDAPPDADPAAVAKGVRRLSTLYATVLPRSMSFGLKDIGRVRSVAGGREVPYGGAGLYLCTHICACLGVHRM